MSTASPSQPMAPASRRPPRKLPASVWLGVLLALLLVAGAVVAGQDALARWGVSGIGSPWLAPLGDATELRAAAWTLPTGIGLVVLGLLVLVIALKPRRATHASVDGDADVWISPDALAALARDAAESVPGVASVKVRATRSKVRVQAGSDTPDSVRDPLDTAVRERLDGAGVSVSTSVTTAPSEGHDA